MKIMIALLLAYSVTAQSQQVPYSEGMTLGAGQSTTVTVKGPVVTDHLFAALLLGGFSNEGIYDSAKTTHEWVFKWMNSYKKEFKKEPCMGMGKGCNFYEWIRQKRFAELKQATPKGQELDTLYLSEGYNGTPNAWQFICKRKDYRKAWSIAQLWMIPYNGLNSQAQRELDEGRKYIISAKIVGHKRLPNYAD